jgi:hypothetical protein
LADNQPAAIASSFGLTRRKFGALTKAGDELKPDDPDSHCFGCGHLNSDDLLLQVIYVGGLSAEAKCEAPAYMCGAPNVVQGGIYAPRRGMPP